MRKQYPSPMRRQPTTLLLALLFSATLSGCALQATQPSSSLMAGHAQGTPLESDLSDFLSRAHSGEIMHLSQSPWGHDVEVETGASYYAASGRECRQLNIQSSSSFEVTQVVACDAGQNWETRRLVTSKMTRGGAF